MKVEIKYIFHNCFILKFPDMVFLFDFPADRFLNPALEKIVAENIHNAKLYCFSSHSHADHFNPNLNKILQINPDTTFIFSDDIQPDLEKISGNTIFVEAERKYTIGPLKIITFKSSDLGVAFLINTENINLYFGGDLANWNWDELDPREKQQMETFYADFLNRLSTIPIDIAFVNTDPRMTNWAGAEEFLNTIKPELFIPMHTFGKTTVLKKFVRNLKNPSPLFEYHRPGDTYVFDSDIE